MLDAMKQPSTEQEPSKSQRTDTVVRSKQTTVQTNRTKTKALRRTNWNVRDTVGAKHVLFGRGKGCANSPGNQRMQRIVDKYRGQYIGGSPRSKRRLLKKAYREIIRGGVKFFKQVGTEDKWVEVDADKAIRKVSHSLRWRQGNIQESPFNPSMAGRKIQDDIPTSDNKTARPQLRQGRMEQQVPPAVLSTRGLEGALLRQAIEQYQLQETLDVGILLGVLPNQMTRSLVRELEVERLQSMALIRTLAFTQPTGPSAAELQALQARQRDQEVLGIIASRVNMSPRLWSPQI